MHVLKNYVCTISGNTHIYNYLLNLITTFFWVGKEKARFSKKHRFFLNSHVFACFTSFYMIYVGNVPVGMTTVGEVAEFVVVWKGFSQVPLDSEQ